MGLLGGSQQVITLVCASDETHLPKQSRDIIPVFSCANIPRGYTGPYVGRRLPDVLARLSGSICPAAYDLLAISMAVTAADTFVDRQQNSDDGWCRVFRVVIEVTSPDKCRSIKNLLEEALHFLSGDMWSFEFTQGAPWTLPRARNPIVQENSDCVSLFSGGLDSAIGVLDAIKEGRTPLLVSHAYQGDSDKQEGIYADFPKKLARVDYIAYPHCPNRLNDVSMRTRSFNFLAMAGVVASSVATKRMVDRVDLLVPENGFIALNPPLTARRLGSHSTRTTHPYFLGLIQEIFNVSGIPARIANPYRHKTKGEMLQECKDQPTLKTVADRTVSCGKWKRNREQCGRCLPCMIRKAAFRKAQMPDGTHYGEKHLSRALSSYQHRDDILAVCLASARSSAEIPAWSAQSGPLPEDAGEYAGWIGVVGRGIEELRQLLRHEKIAP
jgi:hypothetical protein